MKKKIFDATILFFVIIFIGIKWYKSSVNFMASDPNEVAEVTIFNEGSDEDLQQTEDAFENSESLTSAEYQNLTSEEVSNIMHKILDGDMSYITSDRIQFVQDCKGMLKSEEFEVVIVDINADGYEDLVWEGKKEIENSNVRPIRYILSYINGSFQYVFIDTEEASYFSFLSADGGVISASEREEIVGNYAYFLYKYDKDWNKALEYGIQKLCFDDVSELTQEQLEESYPEITNVTNVKDGDVYYLKYIDIANFHTGESVRQKELIEEDEFLQLYKEMTGFDYEETN